jgi:hypothetical protein
MLLAGAPGIRPFEARAHVCEDRARACRTPADDSGLMLPREDAVTGIGFLDGSSDDPFTGFPHLLDASVEIREVVDVSANNDEICELPFLDTA